METLMAMATKELQLQKRGYNFDNINIGLTRDFG